MLSTEMREMLYLCGYSPEDVTADQTIKLMDIDSQMDQSGLSKIIFVVGLVLTFNSIRLMFNGKLLYGAIGLVAAFAIFIFSFIINQKYKKKRIAIIMGEKA